MFQKIAFLFPGQGAQYPGMGKDFVETFPLAREIFEEANDLLKRNLSKIILEGPENTLTETKNSQVAIYVVSYAILRILEQEYPNLKPSVCAGLSLGEYTALTASGKLSYSEGLPLVQYRGEFMNDACEKTAGKMAVVLGLDPKTIETMVKNLHLPNDLWIANYNCPGQVVLSGTLKGIEAGTAAAKAKGAKRVLPLQVHGAFHSGLMFEAEKRLAEYIQRIPIQETPIALVMNVNGDFVDKVSAIKENLINQVTHSVRWQQGIEQMAKQGADLFVEIGCGKTLTGFNKRIDMKTPSISVETVADLNQIKEFFG